MSIHYKTLFELKLMHEFYLTDREGKTVFGETGQDERMKFLLNNFKADLEFINKDIGFEFPQHLQALYKSYHLKLLPTYSGCRVAVRVQPQNLPDNTTVYRPLTPLPEDMPLYILLSKKNNLIDSYTHTLINRSIPSVYFFSNDHIPDAKSFPFITNNVPAYQAGYPYEQGELASFGPGDIRAFYPTSSGAQWDPITGTAFANESDLLLVPLKFYYSFGSAADIQQAVFILKDNNGNTVKETTVSSSGKITKTFLDFSDKTDTISVSGSRPFSGKIFSLDVRGSNGYLRDHKVIFSDTLYSKANWGVAMIRAKPADPSFSLFAGDGFLIERKSPSGDRVKAPTFEIPVKSRFVYWRYLNDQKKELKLIPDLEDYLAKEDKNLLSKKPRPLARYFFLVSNEANTETKYLPNPVDYGLKKDKERLCFDIVVPESGLFPVMP